MIFPASIDAIDYTTITGTQPGLNTINNPTIDTISDPAATIIFDGIFASTTNDSQGFSFII